VLFALIGAFMRPSMLSSYVVGALAIALTGVVWFNGA
jgi:hypothetical protein